LKEYNEKERAFLLGKTDVNPATGKKLADDKEDAEKTRIAFEAEEAKRAEKYAKRREAFERTKKGKEQKEEVASGSTDVVPVELPPLPDKETAKKMPIKDLIALAVARKVDVKANVDAKDVIIEKLYGNT
jgi:sRNA-binding protein